MGRKWQTYGLYFPQFSGKRGVGKREFFCFCLAVLSDQGEVVTPAASRDNLLVLKAKFSEICLPKLRTETSSIPEFKKADENIVSYLADLHILSLSCQHGDLCDDLIWDRIVCGVRSNSIRKQSLKERDLMSHSGMSIC